MVAERSQASARTHEHPVGLVRCARSSTESLPLPYLAHKTSQSLADFWCMPQGKRTAAEKLAFDHMLSNINFLYLGCNVLILLDLSYLSRFWV